MSIKDKYTKTKSNDEISVLWLRPSTGENVSTRRARIADHLEESFVSVTFYNVSLSNPFNGLRSIIFDDYDVIIANVRFPLYMSYPISNILQNPLVADVSDPISQIDDLPKPIFDMISKYEWWILEHTDMAVFAETESYQKARRQGIASVLAKNAVNYDMFAKPSTDSKEFAQSELKNAGVNIDSPIAIYPGRFSPSYHIKDILGAAEIANDWEFVFIGEQMEQKNIERAAEENANIYYLGSYEHDRVPGFLHYADAGLCLVDAERPLKILEYGAAMLPVLGIPGDLEEEFSESQLWFVDPTPQKIVAGLDQIINNPEEADRRCKNLNQTARENSWKEVAETYLGIIQRILNEQ
ncbi:glycosyltransferase [Halopenitus sp. POP-27]|uniref:glycosyltransferase n=1 Tax=Halopenitus sp. POP-27 TaxID=2994425 RepID=UPI002468DB3A|nr:glycosyltransferase [Halopenitus sp. POP-27]